MSCPVITLAELQGRLFRRDAQIIDVREISEYRSGHIEGSTLIPLGELPYRLGEIDRKRDVIVVCRSGSRSAEACTILHNHGYQNARTLAGGLSTWSA